MSESIEIVEITDTSINIDAAAPSLMDETLDEIKNDPAPPLELETTTKTKRQLSDSEDLEQLERSPKKIRVDADAEITTEVIVSVFMDSHSNY
jgi:hypothetical protein